MAFFSGQAVSPLLQSKILLKKIFSAPLEFFLVRNIPFFVASAAPNALKGSEDIRAPDGVQALFVPILLFGGLGYEDFGLYAPLANNDRL